MIIFGWGRTTVKDHGDVVACACSNCRNHVLLRHVVIRVWFTLFFIPVIPYSNKRLMICPVCRNAMSVTTATSPVVEEMQTITANWQAGHLDDDAYSQRVAAFWPMVGATSA